MLTQLFWTNHLLTMDGTWVCIYNSEAKKQAKEQRHTGSLHPKKFIIIHHQSGPLTCSVPTLFFWPYQHLVYLLVYTGAAVLEPDHHPSCQDDPSSLLQNSAILSLREKILNSCQMIPGGLLINIPAGSGRSINIPGGGQQYQEGV